jgi:alkylation response protein AidB-like acyl-CoA dehydrogenase
MFSFEPNEEQKMLIDTIRRFASSDLRPAAHDADEERGYPPKKIEKGWELGILQASIPDEFGGFGEYSAVTGVLAAEEMAWGDLAGALAVMTPALFSVPILLAGSLEQKREYLTKIAESDWQPYTGGWIEPRFDFDANDLRTIAIEDNGAYRLNGQKVFIPFAKEAQEIIVYAGLNGCTQGFIVQSNQAGLSIGDRQSLLGIQALPVYPINLDNVTVEKENRLGGVGGHDLSKILNSAYLASASMAVGVSRAAFEYSRDYAKDREQFGMKIAQKQAIAFMLAEMATEIDAIRLLTWEAAWMMDQGKEEASKFAYLAYTGAVDMAMMVTDRAVQILGGHGYIREHPVELWMRNGRGFSSTMGMAMI